MRYRKSDVVVRDIIKKGKNGVIVLDMARGQSIPYRMLDELFDLASKAGIKGEVDFQVRWRE